MILQAITTLAKEDIDTVAAEFARILTKLKAGSYIPVIL